MLIKVSPKNKNFVIEAMHIGSNVFIVVFVGFLILGALVVGMMVGLLMSNGVDVDINFLESGAAAIQLEDYETNKHIIDKTLNDYNLNVGKERVLVYGDLSVLENLLDDINIDVRYENFNILYWDIIQILTPLIIFGIIFRIKRTANLVFKT